MTPDTTVADLFPPSDARRVVGHRLMDDLLQAEAEVLAGRVTPAADRNGFRDELGRFDFGTPVPLDRALDWTISHLAGGVVHLNHPRYFGLFNPAPAFPAQCADMIASSFNPQLATWTTSPVAVEIEQHVIRAVARRAGFDAATSGHFTSGGSEANSTALLLALTRAHPCFPADGVRAFRHPPVFYVSADSHLAWLKIAHMAGIGRSAVRLVPTDGAGRLDPAALERLLREDRSSGRQPVMIAATAGTTNAGAIDPLEHCRSIALQNGLWYHVDAAWAGAAIASERLARLLDGIADADSVTIDAHKWFAATMGCGMILTRHADRLPTVFHASASYMPSADLAQDPYLNSIQWSRRFLGLRLFLSLTAAGWEGYARHVEQCVDLARSLARELRGLGWSVVNDPSLAVVCSVPPSGSRHVAAIVRRVVSAGNAWVSIARFEGRDVVRACVVNGLTRSCDIDILVAELQEADRAIVS
jgi:glutamate/tyrosine decarboxylase-like PLP-dependent enzyme